MIEKISKLLSALMIIIREPVKLNLLLNDNDRFKKMVDKNHGDLNIFPVVSLADLISFPIDVNPFAFLDGGSTPPDLALLKGLALKTSNCDYLEIGSWRGESLANVAPFARECYAINLSDEEMKNMGLSQDSIDQHFFFSSGISNIKIIKENSFKFNFSGLNKKFDIIFLDGDHSYHAVKNDTEKTFPLLKNENSVIVWHDAARYYEQPRYEVIAGILDGLPEKERKFVYFVENTLCAIYTRQPLKTFTRKGPYKPRHFYKVGLEIKSV